ncbi:SDR family oxidoreductase [Acetobacter sp.]|uniref:SDR family oxidoreductase n=1 Tax=Acetobacter sp. TaxID=440 RepID=UPI0025C2A56A|nr:SDR family oxidoreductase [Acetobacter sp.]MCH4091874.1 SDR family oxidoreductase [Acetobacter sp.]
MTRWTVSDIPSQKGRSAVITGTRGLGLETARALTRAGGEVILAGRNPQKGMEAVATIRAEIPSANISFEEVDLASLKSVAAFAARLRHQRDGLDLLVNNAAVMNPPKRLVTEDGFELQFGTNYLGHFALTAHLLPLLRSGKDARVVTLSSIAARGGAIDFDDLQAHRRYRPMQVYGQSKLACLMFAFEMQRRSKASGWGVTSMAAHPGLSRTDLLASAPGRNGRIGVLLRLLRPVMTQPVWQGALPTLFAATSPDAKPGGYYGPDRVSETRGYPGPAKVPPRALDKSVAARLWVESERLTGVVFGSGDARGVK